MSGEGWSCFAHLPSGLIDSRSASLTLNWLRPKPTYTGFKLTRDEVDTPKYERILRLRRIAVFAGAILGAGIFAVLVADRLFGLSLFETDLSAFAAVWTGTSSILLSLFFFALTSVPVMRYRRAGLRRAAFLSACVEFEQVDDWRRTRCEVKFWSERLSEAEFEFEAAELLAGYLKTGQVMLTRPVSDYGVDVLVCAPVGRVVAQCKQWKSRGVGAAQVRELAGSKAYFGADFAYMLSLQKPSEDSEQCAAIGASQRIEFWDAAHIVAVARQLRNGNGG